MSNLARTLISIFITLHGLVHLWFVVLSLKLIDFQEEMGWTGESVFLSKFLNGNITSFISTIMFAISAVLFIFSGITMFMQTSFWEKALFISAFFSTLTIILFWDGSHEMMVEKGIIGVLINIALIFFILK